MKDWIVNDVTFRVVKLTDLIIPEYQRKNSLAKSKRIAKSWDWEFAKVLTVKKLDKTYEVVDGQGRVIGARLKFAEIDHNTIFFPAIVTEKVGHIAFIGSNGNTTSVSKKEKFMSAYNGGSIPIIRFVRKLKKAGIGLNPYGQAAAGFTNCPEHLFDISELIGPRDFSTFLVMLQESFSRPDNEVIERASLTADFLTGLKMLLTQIDYDIEDVSVAFYNADKSAESYLDKASSETVSRYGQRYNLVRNFIKVIENAG